MRADTRILYKIYSQRKKKTSTIEFFDKKVFFRNKNDECNVQQYVWNHHDVKRNDILSKRDVPK